MTEQKRTLESIPEIRARIEKEAKRLGLDANKMMREYGVTTALAQLLENLPSLAERLESIDKKLA